MRTWIHAHLGFANWSLWQPLFESTTMHDFLEAAQRIGQGLMTQATRDLKNHPQWQGDDLQTCAHAAHKVVRTQTGVDLYSGTAGIAWFLAHLGAYTQNEQMRDLAVHALQGAVAQSQAHLNDLSLYTGASGVAMAALQVGQHLGHMPLQAQACALGAVVAQQVLGHPCPMEFDLIGGCAGMAVALAALHRLAAIPNTAAACQHLAQHLLKNAFDDGCFSSWPDTQAPPSAPHLCGLAHGASGIAWGLWEAAQLGPHTGSELARGAAQALAYERTWFNPTTCSWPDLRQPWREPATTSMNAWCHGGIGMAAVRLHMQAQQPQPNLLADAGAGLHGAREVVVAAQRALSSGQTFDATLCHGLAGAAELYNWAHQATGVIEHARAAKRVAQLCLNLLSLTGGRWSCGLQGAQQIPGLMLGEAGIGAMLLRMHDPCAMPCTLLPGRSECGR
jgi:lantibiotic biosynthesis protein